MSKILDLIGANTDAAMIKIAEAIQTGARVAVLLKQALTAVEDKDKTRAKKSLEDALAVAESNEDVYGYPEPKVEEAASEEELEYLRGTGFPAQLSEAAVEGLTKAIQDAIDAVDDEDWEAVTDAINKALKLVSSEVKEADDPDDDHDPDDVGNDPNDSNDPNSDYDTEEWGEAESAAFEESYETADTDANSGRVMMMEAGSNATDGGPAVLLVELIRPGWGNKRDNMYYPSKVLERDARAFVGCKMFETNHKPNETTNRSWVSTVVDIHGIAKDGTPIAEVVAHDPNFAQRVRNLNIKGLLGKLECSIKADGRVRPGFSDGSRNGKFVEAITKGISVDWVTKAGAGGHATQLLESDVTNTNTDTKVTRERVVALVSGSRLPLASQKRLAERYAEFTTEETVKAAILMETEYVKALTKSGDVFGQGAGAGVSVRLSEVERAERFDAIDKRYGIA